MVNNITMIRAAHFTAGEVEMSGTTDIADTLLIHYTSTHI